MVGSNVISVDFVIPGTLGDGSGNTGPCSGDTTLTGTAMKNAGGNIFTGQVGAWNALNIGTYNNNSAISGFLLDGTGATTTVKLALGRATGLDNTTAGGWRCDPNAGGTSGATKQLRAETAYLYYPALTVNHYAWAITGLKSATAYKLTFFGGGPASATASNVAFAGTALAVSAVRDSVMDRNWTTITSDSGGTISGAFTDTGNNQTVGLYGMQIQEIPPALTPYQTWASAHAGGQSATASDDYNHDGVANGIAFFMGMNGTATLPGIVNGKITWPHVGTVTSFGVQVSDNLTTWQPANAADIDTASSPGFVIYTLPVSATRKFCRLVVTP